MQTLPETTTEGGADPVTPRALQDSASLPASSQPRLKKNNLKK